MAFCNSLHLFVCSNYFMGTYKERLIFPPPTAVKVVPLLPKEGASTMFSMGSAPAGSLSCLIPVSPEGHPTAFKHPLSLPSSVTLPLCHIPYSYCPFLPSPSQPRGKVLFILMSVPSQRQALLNFNAAAVPTSPSKQLLPGSWVTFFLAIERTFLLWTAGRRADCSSFLKL